MLHNVQVKSRLHGNIHIYKAVSSKVSFTTASPVSLEDSYLLLQHKQEMKN